MSKPRLLVTFLLFLSVAACACSQPFVQSPHYATVTKHLDVGAQVLLYADIEGDLDAGAAQLDGILDRASKTYPDLKLANIDTRDILKRLGLDQLVALGLSSSKDGKAFHNRAFLEYGKERRGLLLMTGAPAHALEVPRQAPGDADLVFESDLKIKSLVNLVESILKHVADEKGFGPWDPFADLEEKLPGTSLTLRQLIDRLDTRVVGVLRIDEARSFPWPGDQKIKVPGFDVLLSLDDVAVLFDSYAGLLRNLPIVTSSSDGDMQWLEIDVGIAAAPWLRPVLAKNAKTGRVFAATSKAFVKEYLADKKAAGKTLAQASDWERATDRFLPEANGLSYMSGAFLAKVVRFARTVAKDDKEAQAGIDLALELLPEPGIPFAAQQVSMPDGLYYTSYATTSHKSTLFSALLAGPTALAGIVTAVATSGLRKYLRASKAGDDHATTSPTQDNEDEEVGENQKDDGDRDRKEAGEAPANQDVDAQLHKPSRSNDVSEQVYRIPLDRSPARGGRAPKVTIVEFSDFQCPFCSRARLTLDELATIYSDDLRLVFKHNPLSFHKRAVPAALAAEAARAQGKFWAMHDKLFANQRSLSDEDLARYAEDIGLDMAKYRSALRREKRLRKRIDADQSVAARFGATGTPSFFVNGRPVRGARGIDVFKKLIDEEIAKADEKLRQGVPRKRLYVELTKNGLANARPRPRPGSLDPDKTYWVGIEGAPVRGAKNALVTIVMFSDYECPYCRRVEPTLERILKEYKRDVRVVWRDMPLPFHRYAKSAAIAARAAGEQGRYWEMHDKLVADVSARGAASLQDADLERYAEELGLDMTAFALATKQESLAEAVEWDLELAKELGTRGTPSFFINGKFLAGAQPFAAFKQKIDAELKSARKLVAKGTPRSKVYDVVMRNAKTQVEETH